MNLVFGLSLVALVILIALYIHGWWQARALAPKQARRPSAGGASAESEQADAGVADMQGSDDLPVDRVQPKMRVRPKIDVLVDLVIPIALEQPLRGERIRSVLPKAWRVGNKSVFFEGMTETGSQWELIRVGRTYRQLQAGVQLTNRHGPLNELEYSELVQMLNTVTDKIAARPDVPDMMLEVARARELDAFAQEVDLTLTLYLRARKASWIPAYVHEVATDLGFGVAAVPGRMVLPCPETDNADYADAYFISADGEGAESADASRFAGLKFWPQPPLLALQYDTRLALADSAEAVSIEVLALSFDVPQIELRHQPFEVWAQVAKDLAQRLDAEILDNHGHPLTPDMYANISQWLQSIYRMLSQRDLSAGSPLARRLFS